MLRFTPPLLLAIVVACGTCAVVLPELRTALQRNVDTTREQLWSAVILIHKLCWFVKTRHDTMQLKAEPQLWGGTVLREVRFSGWRSAFSDSQLGRFPALRILDERLCSRYGDRRVRKFPNGPCLLQDLLDSLPSITTATADESKQQMKFEEICRAIIKAVRLQALQTPPLACSTVGMMARMFTGDETYYHLKLLADKMATTFTRGGMKMASLALAEIFPPSPSPHIDAVRDLLADTFEATWLACRTPNATVLLDGLPLFDVVQRLHAAVSAGQLRLFGLLMALVPHCRKFPLSPEQLRLLHELRPLATAHVLSHHPLHMHIIASLLQHTTHHRPRRALFPHLYTKH